MAAGFNPFRVYQIFSDKSCTGDRVRCVGLISVCRVKRESQAGVSGLSNLVLIGFPFTLFLHCLLGIESQRHSSVRLDTFIT